MKNTLSPPLVAVFQAEVLYNLKRVAPYALMVIFSANAAATAPTNWATM